MLFEAFGFRGQPCLRFATVFGRAFSTMLEQDAERNN